MFRNPDLPELVRLLEQRGVYLYHACQFGDFLSYLELGGIPSRQLLQERDLNFTRFTTDEVDQDNRVWDKVFVNWEDFGYAFANERVAAPNAYGPIIVRIHPRALLHADDVAVCLRSAGARGFDRDRESLYSISQVDRLFWKPADAGRGTARLKFRDELKAAFGPRAEAVEVSCTCPGGVLPWDHAVDIVVDPYQIEGAGLIDHVADAVEAFEAALPVRRRPTERPERYQMLLNAIRARTPGLDELAQTLPDDAMRRWAQEVQGRGGILQKNYVRWADYLRAGTLQRLRPRAAVPSTVYEDAPSLGDEDFGDWAGEDYYDPYEEERDLLRAELDDYRESYQRANEDGWFYDDADEDEISAIPWNDD